MRIFGIDNAARGTAVTSVAADDEKKVFEGRQRIDLI